MLKLTIGRKLGLTFLALAALAGGMVVMSLVSADRSIDHAVEKTAASANREISLILTAEASRAAEFAAQVAARPDVQRLTAARDRESLRDALRPTFDELRRREPSTEQFQIFTGDTPRAASGPGPFVSAWFRMQAFDRTGDSVPWRIMLMRALASPCSAILASYKGLEMSTSGVAMHGAVPICDGGRNVGVINVGLRFDKALLERIRERTQVSHALYLPADLVNGQLPNPPVYRSLLGLGQLVYAGDRLRFALAGGAHDARIFGEDEMVRAFRGEVQRRRIEMPGTGGAAWASVYPVYNFSGETIGVMESFGDASALEAEAATARTSVSAISAIALLVMVGLWFALSRSIVRPILETTATMRKLADGNLAVEIHAGRRQDEIGEMTLMLEEFRSALMRSRALEREQAELKDKMEKERRTEILTLADSFESSVHKVVHLLDSSVGTVKAASVKMSHAASQTQGLSESVSRSSEETSSNVQTVAAAAEEMSASIREIARQAIAARDATSKAVASVQATDKTVTRLGAAAASINEIVTAISDIANKTNLLALNATIEAARAGESGKGFAVVASEVKALAMQTKRATEEIGGKISMMQAVTLETSQSVGSVTEIINSVDGIAAAIAAATEQQSAATNEIVRNVQSASQGIQTVTENISSVRASAHDSATVAQEVSGVTVSLVDDSGSLKQRIEDFLKRLRAA